MALLPDSPWDVLFCATEKLESSLSKFLDQATMKVGAKRGQVFFLDGTTGTLSPVLDKSEEQGCCTAG